MESRDDQLGDLDQRALDALVDAGFELQRCPSELRERCARVAAVLALLECPADQDARVTVAERTMARVIATRTLTEDTLVPEDGAALDALVAADYDPAAVGEPLRSRAARLDAFGRLLTGPSSSDGASGELAARAFDLVMLAADRPVGRLEPQAPAPRVRWLDLAGMAAMLLVGASVVVPVMSAARQQQVRGGCTANMGSIASALSTYASTYRDALPIASASMGPVWWDVGGGPGRSNSANLFTLARTGFAKVRDLACPGNARACAEAPAPEATDWHSIDTVSYSYQVMFGPRRVGWRDPSRCAVLADRSPVILRNLAGEPAIPMENSPNHCLRGQSVLFCDGSVRWQGTPVLSDGDNIWLPWQVEQVLRELGEGRPVTLEGKEFPGTEHDAFLAP